MYMYAHTHIYIHVYSYAYIYIYVCASVYTALFKTLAVFNLKFIKEY